MLQIKFNPKQLLKDIFNSKSVQLLKPGLLRANVTAELAFKKLKLETFIRIDFLKHLYDDKEIRNGINALQLDRTW